MSDLFNTYESDYQVTYQEAQQRLSSIPNLDGEQRKIALRAIERASDECLEIIDQMNIEVQNIPSSQRASYNANIRTNKTQVDEVKRNLKKLLDEEDRYQLFGGRTTADSDEDGDQRHQLLKSNASLERSSDRLRDSHRIALETENIGGDILNNLRGQREQIVNSRNTLGEADSYIDKSIRTLRTMTRRMATNKMITYAIIAVLILLILLVIASKFW